MVQLEQLVGQLESLTPESLAELASFVAYLKWKQGPLPTSGVLQAWSFDFVEHFRRAVLTAEHDPAGMEIQVGEAACAGETRMALWEHPPVQGSAIVEYQVPVPPDVTDLKLRFATGIRDGSQLAEGNLVAFRVFVNDWRIWSGTQRAQEWKEHEVQMPTMPGDVARVQFVTDGLGNHEWAWAVWGDPKLVARTAG